MRVLGSHAGQPTFSVRETLSHDPERCQFGRLPDSRDKSVEPLAQIQSELNQRGGQILT
jgi:hypothetical protein